MLLLRGNAHETGGPEVWTACTDVRAEPCEVLRALTDPDAIAAWAPMSFELREPDARPLRTGSRECVSGSVAGLRASFDVEVLCADETRLELVAEGPLAMDVAYRLRPRGGGVQVHASIGLRSRGGLTGQVLRAAIGALLNAGALERALGRLDRSLCEHSEHQLVAA
jgi:Polyketide cyclase / dehydrase and lipid transport